MKQRQATVEGRSRMFDNLRRGVNANRRGVSSLCPKRERMDSLEVCCASVSSEAAAAPPPTTRSLPVHRYHHRYPHNLEEEPALLRRNNTNQDRQQQQLLRSRFNKRAIMLLPPRSKTAGCVRAVLAVSVLGLGSVSLLANLWWLPFIAIAPLPYQDYHDAHVPRNTMGIPRLRLDPTHAVASRAVAHNSPDVTLQQLQTVRLRNTTTMEDSPLPQQQIPGTSIEQAQGDDDAVGPRSAEEAVVGSQSTEEESPQSEPETADASMSVGAEEEVVRSADEGVGRPLEEEAGPSEDESSQSEPETAEEAEEDLQFTPVVAAAGGLVGGYLSAEEMSARSTRFPSVDERVQVYMTNWYLPPCEAREDNVVRYNYVPPGGPEENNAGTEWMIFREARTAKEKLRGRLRTFAVDDSTDFDLLRHLNPRRMQACRNKYCTDTVKYLFPAIARSAATAATNSTMSSSDAPVFLYQFSDAEKTRAYIPAAGRAGPYPNVPLLKKFRYALSAAERERVVKSDTGCAPSPRKVPLTVVQQQQQSEEGGNTNNKIVPTAQPVIFKLKMQRHYGYVHAIPAQDRPWSRKKDQAIFRGQFTGRFPAGMDKSAIAQLPAVEQCQLLHRCRLVYNSAVVALAAAAAAGNATTAVDEMLPLPLVDAKLALPVLDVRRDFPKTVDGIDLYGERVSIAEMLTYKAIIMLEGNDVSSGLKWALFSNSVVMTQTPTKTSWAMEELLEPWVHYIPLADDLSDVQEKMQWVIDNDEEAQVIANRGKLWISDLVYHPDAETDEQHIFDEIVRRYEAHFVRDPRLQLPPSIQVK